MISERRALNLTAAIIVTSMMNIATVVAAPRSTTIVGVPTLDDLPNGGAEASIRISSADGRTYILEAPSDELRRIAGLVRTDPTRKIAFEGSVDDEGNGKRLLIREWKEIFGSPVTTTAE